MSAGDYYMSPGEEKDQAKIRELNKALAAARSSIETLRNSSEQVLREAHSRFAVECAAHTETKMELIALRSRFGAQIRADEAWARTRDP